MANNDPWDQFPEVKNTSGSEWDQFPEADAAPGSKSEWDQFPEAGAAPAAPVATPKMAVPLRGVHEYEGPVNTADIQHETPITEQQQQEMAQAQELLYQAGKSNADPMAAATQIHQQFPSLAKADPAGLAWYIQHYRQGGKTPVNWFQRPQQDIAVTANKADVGETTGQAIGASAHDLAKGVGEGWDAAGNSVAGFLAHAADATGLTDDSVEKYKKALEAQEADNEYIHPEGWSRTIGNLVGETPAMSGIFEAAPLGGEALSQSALGRIGAGAATGAAYSGGENIPEKAAEGALTAGAFEPLFMLGGHGRAADLMKTHAESPATEAPSGTVRMYRSGDGADGGWFTSSKTYAEQLAKRDKTKLWYTDVSRDHPAFANAIEGQGPENGFTFNHEFEPHEVSAQPVPKEPTKAAVARQAAAKEVAGVQDQIDNLTKDWQNGPQFNVVHSTKDLPGPIQDALKKDGATKAFGLVDEDGTVHLIAKNIKDKSMVPAVVFHETLGHVGLKQEFGDGLDNVLTTLHERNPEIRKLVAKYEKDHPNLYKGPDGTARRVEEVLAEMSEKGQIKPTMSNKIVAYVRNFARQRDWKWAQNYTWSEVQHILSMAHDNIVNGHKKSSTFNGLRYMATVWHGSPHDFDRFNHEHIGSGEGAQVYGWGTYLTDTKDIAEGYRKKLSEEETTWRGVPNRVYQIRNQAIDGADREFGDELAGSMAGDVFTNLRDGMKAPPPEHLVGWRHDPEYVEHLKTNEPEEYARQLKLAEDVTKYVGDNFKRNSKGKLYEVNIPDNAHYLDWDNEIRDQEQVKKALEKAGVKTVNTATWQKIVDNYQAAERRFKDINHELDFLQAEIDSIENGTHVSNFLGDEPPTDADIAALNKRADELYDEVKVAHEDYKKASDTYSNSLYEMSSGDEAYSLLSDKLGSAKAASQFLHENGVVGTKYLDAFSRRKGDGTFNYVMYHDETPEITNKYMMPKKDRAGSISLDKYVSADDAVKDYLRDVAEELPKGEKRTWREIGEKSVELGLNRKKILREGEGLSPEFVLGSLNFLQDSAKRIVMMADELPDDATEEQTAKFVRAMALHAHVQERITGIVSNAGRVLNVLKMERESASALRKMFKEMNERGMDMSDPENVRYMAKMLKDADGDPAKVAKITRDAFGPLPEDYLTSWHYASMLSGWKSLEHNIVGHTFGSLLNNVTMVGAAIGGSIGKRAGLLPEDAISLSHLRYRMYGYMNAITDGGLYNNVYESFKTSRVDAANGNDSWANSARIPGIFTAPERLHAASYSFFGDIEKSANIYQRAITAAKEGDLTAGEIDQLRTTLLNKGLRGRSLETELSAAIERRKTVNVDKGFEGDELSDRIMELAQDPHKELVKAAMRDANAVRFMGEGSITKGMRRLLARPEPDDYLMRFFRFAVQNIVPFANIAEQKFLASMRYAPGLGHLVDPLTRAQWKEGIQGRQMVATRYMMGASAIATAFAAPEEMDDFLEQHKDIIAEVPTLNLFKMVRDAIHEYQKLDKDTPESTTRKVVESLFHSVGVMASAMQHETFLRSINDYFVARAYGGKALDRYVGMQVQNWMPYAALSREITGMIDPTKRDTTGENTEDTIINTIKATTPGLSTSLPARHDPFGREVKKGDTREDDPIVKEVNRLTKEANAGKVLVGPVKRDAQIGIKSAEDVQKYQALSGKYIYDDLKAEMSKPEWKTMSNENKIDLIRDIVKDQRENAREELGYVKNDD